MNEEASPDGRVIWHMKMLFGFLAAFYLLFFFTVWLHGQDHHFVRSGAGYELVSPKETIIFRPPVDTRPIWQRALLSLRPWAIASPGTKLEYNEELNLYELDGQIGVGLRGKVEF